MLPSRCFALALFVLLVDRGPASAQDFLWRKAFGTPDSDLASGSAPDGSGGYVRSRLEERPQKRVPTYVLPTVC